MKYKIKIALTDGQMDLVKKLSRTKSIYSTLKMFNIGNQAFVEANETNLNKIFKL